MKRRGICSVCGREYDVTSAGVIRQHWSPEEHRKRYDWDCPGVRQRPARLLPDELTAAAVKALREAANDLQAMTVDPTDESVGVRGPIAVALWLCDRANRIEAEAANAPA